MAIAAGRRRAAGDDADHADRAPGDQAADLGHGLAHRDRRRQQRCRDRLPRAHGRDRRDRAHRCGVQEQLDRTPQASRGADRGRHCRRRAAQGRIARLRRRVPDQRRRHPRQGAQLLRRIRARREAAHRDGADHRRPVRAVGRRFRDRIRARPLRGDRLRRTLQLDRGNHPPGPGIERDRGRRRQAGRRHRPAHQRTVGSRRADRRRGEADHLDCRADQSCWRSTPPSRRRARATPAAALRWWRRRSRASPARPRRRPRRSPARSATCSLRPKSSVSAIKAIGQTIERISDIATSISAAVEQQRGATQNIAQSVRAAASGTADVAVNIRNAAQGADETGETSSRMFASRTASVRRKPAAEGRGRKVPRPRPGRLTRHGGGFR